MAIERRDPIPPGVYYLDVFNPVQAGWDMWLFLNREMQEKPKIRVISTHPIQVSAGTIVSATIASQKGNTYLFKVLEPVERWPADLRLGFPTIAPEGEKTDLGKMAEIPREQLEAPLWSKMLLYGGIFTIVAIVARPFITLTTEIIKRRK